MSEIFVTFARASEEFPIRVIVAPFWARHGEYEVPVASMAIAMEIAAHLAKLHHLPVRLDSRLIVPNMFPDDDRLSVVKEYALAGQKINAIKEYRGLTGCGLKEAKDAVEDMMATGNWILRHTVMVR